VRIEDAFMGNGRRAATAADIRAALRLYIWADAMLISLLAVAALVVSAIG
jgi:adenosylcobinamide-phosphate synthase